MMPDLLHAYTADLISGAERRMAQTIGRPVQQPMTERRRDWPRRDRFSAIVTGADAAFWWTPGTPHTERADYEQELELFDAVRFAVSLPCASPAERWAVIERAVRNLAFDYTEKE